MSISVHLTYKKMLRCVVAVKEDKEKTAPLSCRIPAVQNEMIEALKTRGLLGNNRSAVVRALLQRAIDSLVETEYVRKHQETLGLLKKK